MTFDQYIRLTAEELQERRREPVLAGFEHVADVADESIEPIMRHVCHEHNNNHTRTHT